MAFTFGEKKPAKHGEWGIGDMQVHIYISPVISVDHNKAALEAVHEFFNLFPERKDWFKINLMPWVTIENVVKNQPTEYHDITDLLGFYYNPEFEKIYKGNKTPLTTITVMPHNQISGYNGAGMNSSNHTIIFDLLYPEHLKSVIKHELGHRFGCGHCIGDCIMNPSGIGTHFCRQHIQEMQIKMAALYANSSPFTFGEPIKPKSTFTFGKPEKYK